MNFRDKTISVNPSRPTAGESYAKAVSAIEAGARRLNAPFRFPVIDALESHTDGLRKTLALIFGVSGSRDGMTAPKDSVALMGRIGFGLFLLTCGILTAGTPSSTAIIILGATLMAGLLTRASMLLFGAVEAWSAWHIWLDGNFSYGFTVLAAMSLIMAFIGPGHISIDSFIERRLYHTLKQRLERRMRARRCSYQAYKYHM